jgi:hypothetical protein
MAYEGSRRDAAVRGILMRIAHVGGRRGEGESGEKCCRAGAFALYSCKATRMVEVLDYYLVLLRGFPG